MASRVMSYIIFVMLSFWSVIDSWVVVLVGDPILNLVLDVEDGRRCEVDGRFYWFTLFVDKTRVSCLLNLGNHRCQYKGHDYCRELCPLYIVMCFLGSAVISTSDGAYLPPPRHPAIWLAFVSCYYICTFMLVTRLY